MRSLTKSILLFLLGTVTLAACVNQRELNKRQIQRSMQTYAGEYHSDAGDVLIMVPVYSRMIGMDTIYVERTSAAGTSGRIISLEVSSDGSRIVQLAYVFQQQNQWRNLREQPELFSALLPKDVRPAGTCDIKLAEDMNSVTYSCGGSAPVTFKRVQHQPDN
jgi:hypothetical protein